MVNTNSTNEAFAFQLDEFYLDLQDDGNKISILDKEKISERPFPGLRPFKTAEFQLFKGRDGQAEELIKRLKKSYFLSVIGSSGTGKSSLVRAGLIPQLFGGYLHEAGSKWNIAICRPGKDPVENLAIALSSVKTGSKDKELIYKNYQKIEPLLSNSIYGILEVEEMLNKDTTGNENSNLLIIIDQFEELFRFDRKDLGKENIENHFISLLLKAALNPASSVYVIITMRSEFLGDCVKYRGLPEAINEGQYLVPQLSRAQLKDVIEGPVGLAGKKIAPGLVELLINEIDENKLKQNLDQLPILQHALMRTYQEAMKHGPDTLIDYQHYKAIGGMDLALANHAESKYKELGNATSDELNPSKKQQIAKIIFQALTDASADQKGGRRPTELENIYLIAQSINATEDEVDQVINQFRDIDTSFIMPPINNELQPKLMIDISHESLMRNWAKLNKWIEEEVRDGRLYKQLNERRGYNEIDPHDFLRGFLLKELVDWRNASPKNYTWASRYHQVTATPDSDLVNKQLYDKNMLFLKTSETKNLEAIAEAKKKMEEEVDRAHQEESRKKIMWIFAAASLISICFGLWAFAERRSSVKQSKLATESASYAEMQKIMFQQKAKEADLLRTIAEKRRIIADTQRVLAESARDAANRYLKQLNFQKEEAMRLKNKAEQKNEESRKQLVRNTLQKESFYASNILDPDTKETIITALFLEPPHKTEEIPLKDYINLRLLKNIDSAVEAREQLQEEPKLGLRKAESVWKETKDPNVQNILSGIFKKNIFFNHEIEPESGERFSSYKLSSLAVSKDAAHFACSHIDKITTGSYKRGRLVMDPETPGETEYNNSTSNAANYYSSTKILALTYVDDRILSFQDDGKVIEWINKEKHTIDSLPAINSINIITAEFSPDGKSLVVAFRNGQVKIWNVAELAKGNRAPLVDTSSQNRYISQVTCSPDNKKMLKFFTNGKIELWNLATNKQAAFKYDLLTYAANFSPDGNYILAAGATGNIVYVLDTLGRRRSNLLLSPDEDNEDYAKEDNVNARIDYLALSQDWKRIVTKQDSKVFIFQKANGDSLLRMEKGLYNRDYSSNSGFICKSMTGASGITKVSFLNTNTIITLNYLGYLHLWDLDISFDNLDDAFASVEHITALSFREKLDLGQLSYTEIITTPDKDNLRRAAIYFQDQASFKDEDDPEKKDNLGKAKSLYIKLSKLDSGYNKISDQSRIIEINEELIVIEKANSKPNYHRISELYKENTIIGESKLKSDDRDSTKMNELSLAYWNLSWNQLFDKNFESAISSSKRGFELYPANDGIVTNLALGYLLTKRFAEADSVYKKYRGKTYSSNAITSFNEVFLSDITELQNAGIITTADPALNKKIIEIKQMLQQGKN